MSGVKFDDNKPALDLLPGAELLELGKVMAYGAKKYGRHNWTKGLELSRLVGAGLRHLNQFNAGENLDEETQLSHLAHAASNCLMALWTLQNRHDLDDRIKKTSFKRANPPHVEVPNPTAVKSYTTSYYRRGKEFCSDCDYGYTRCACPKPRSGAQ